MSNDERSAKRDVHTEEDLARILTEIGPLMLHLKDAETKGPDPAFERNLRTRLIGEMGKDIAPDPAFASALRAHLVGGKDAQHRWIGVSLTLAAVVATILVVGAAILGLELVAVILATVAVVVALVIRARLHL